MAEVKYHRFKRDDVDQFIDNDIYFPTRTIYMGSQTYIEGEESGTDHLMAEKMVKLLHILDSQAPNADKPINIIMNNPGGEVTHGMAIYDAIKLCKNHVTIKVIGQASSMGSIILQAADHRVMTENSKIVIHWGGVGVSSSNRNVYKNIDNIKTTDKWMVDMFLEKVGGKEIPLSLYLKLIGKQEEIPKNSTKQIKIEKKQLEKMLDFDTFIDAKTALRLNLIDGILE
jgi:ATP-dependent Clp endopeptidase proteolytic subunit ClpP